MFSKMSVRDKLISLYINHLVENDVITYDVIAAF